MYLEISYFIFLILLRLFLNYKLRYTDDSDSFFHLSLIDHIRKNSNKFSSKCDRFLLPGDLEYPYLFHKILSYFIKEFVYKYRNYLRYFY